MSVTFGEQGSHINDLEETFSTKPDEIDPDFESDAPGIFELIKRVGNRRILYDSEHQKHFDRNAVRKSWNEVADDLKVGAEIRDAKWCQGKWKKLKDYYGRKKRAAVKKSGAGGGKGPIWPYYGAIHTIMASCHTENQSTITNLDGNDDDRPIQETGEEQEKGDEAESTGNTSSGTNSTPSLIETPSTAVDSKRKRRKSESDDATAKLIELLKDTGKDEDAEFHFAMMIAEKLRKLSPRSNQKAQMKIQRIFFKLEFPDSD